MTAALYSLLTHDPWNARILVLVKTTDIMNPRFSQSRFPEIRRLAAALIGLLAFAATTVAVPVPMQYAAPISPGPRSAVAQPLVQIALLLDTSNSMDGLISQAKSQLWKIVNEFKDARREGQVPIVQVALYEYGNNRLSASSGYVRQILAFTTDLDRVSEELFRLVTDGGEEYCGWVIRDAVRDLQWSQAGNDYKAIFIAGNEPFTQGTVSYVDACRAAIGRGIVVNTIHCGTESDGREGHWIDGAKLAEGRFMIINQDAAVVRVATPYDDRIAALGVELNRTYIPYGDPAEARAAQNRQSAQDAGATANRWAGSSVERALTKASSNYRNSNWDLVDACRENIVKFEEIDDSRLPAELRGRSSAAKREYVAAKGAERTKLQLEIDSLNRERTRWLELRRPASPAAATLDRAVSEVVRSQAIQHHFEFPTLP